MKPEDRFIEALRALLPEAQGLVVGPGDDAAVLAPTSGPLVATTDMIVEGVDFLPGDAPEAIGRRAVAVNLSDLAAMGARPRFLLLAIGFPPSRGEEFALGVTRGALERAGEFGVAIAGGDLSSAPQAVVSVAMWGEPVGQPLLRSGASPGDLLFVSGLPGRAAAGLTLAKRLAVFSGYGSPPTPRFVGLAPTQEAELLAAYHDPDPRVALGIWLSREGIASSAIDVSDGLAVDAARLARASGVRAVIEKARLPVSPALRAFGELEGVDPVEWILAGGDDYELLFSVRPEAAEHFEISRPEWNVPVTRIGVMEAGSGAVLRTRRGDRDIAALGHDHFETNR